MSKISTSNHRADATQCARPRSPGPSFHSTRRVSKLFYLPIGRSAPTVLISQSSLLTYRRIGTSPPRVLYSNLQTPMYQSALTFPRLSELLSLSQSRHSRLPTLEVSTFDARGAEMPKSRPRFLASRLPSVQITPVSTSETRVADTRSIASSRLRYSRDQLLGPSNPETRCPETTCHVTTPVVPAIYEIPRNFALRDLAVSTGNPLIAPTRNTDISDPRTESRSPKF
jgi:hypothetical protein